MHSDFRKDTVDITTALIDDITAAFLAALATGGTNLGVYSLAILSLCATITYYKDYAMVIMHGTGLGDALAGLLVYVMGVMGYYWLMVNLFPIAQAALATAIQWGLAGTGGTSLTAEMIQKPSFIMTEGLKAAYPMADQASWFERIWASVKMVNKPGELVAYWCVVLAFLAITTHHMMMLIEYHLSVMCAAVLIPWGLWSATSSVGEFAVGWLTGGFIRALVSTAMLGIALPLFGLLNKPAEGFITLYNTVMLIGGAFIFAVLAWVIPARAAGIASRGMSLAVHGGTVTAAAMTFARFGMMAQGAGAVATRAHSRMMAARQMAHRALTRKEAAWQTITHGREYANQDNVNDAYQDLQEGVFDDQDHANEAQAKYDRVASEILRRDGNAEWREWRAYRIGGAVALALLLQTAVLAWAVYHVGQGPHRRPSGAA